MSIDINLVQRTDAKLRFARLHLDELRNHPRLGSGDDRERAHEESILYHLVGVKDAFLHEIQVAHGLGLDLNQVDERTLDKELKRTGSQSRALEKLDELYKESSSWYSLMVELRNHGSHRYHINRLMKVGLGSASDMPRTSHFKDPRTGQNIEEHSVELLNQSQGGNYILERWQRHGRCKHQCVGSGL